MKSINAINNPTLRNDEFYGLYSEVVTLAKGLTDKDVKQAVAAFEETLSALGSFLELSLTKQSQEVVGTLDKERNEVFSACKSVARGSQNHPDEKTAKVWAQIWNVFDGCPVPHHLNQTQSTGVFLNLVQGLRSLGDDTLESVGFKVWVDKLSEVNDKFIAADTARFAEKSVREQEQAKKLRAACLESFRVLSATVAYKAIAGNEACATFIDSANKAISTKKAQVKARKTHAKQSSTAASVTATVNNTAAVENTVAVENTIATPSSTGSVSIAGTGGAVDSPESYDAA